MSTIHPPSNQPPTPAHGANQASAQPLITVDGGGNTALHRQLARSIADFVRLEGMQSGDSLSQAALAVRLGVSRTPVRAALKLLHEAGVVRLDARHVTVADPDAGLPFEDRVEPRDSLLWAISRARRDGELPDSVTEADMMRRFDCPRSEVAAALRQLASLGVVERKPGHGWRFLETADSAEDRHASYRFRMIIEPAALLEPSFAIASAWLAEMRQMHQHYLSRSWQPSDSIKFYEMNAAFHRGLVAASGNRYLLQAVEQQNALRRLRNYSWRIGADRVRVSCEEHLAVIAALEQGDRGGAARCLSRHLDLTGKLTV